MVFPVKQKGELMKSCHGRTKTLEKWATIIKRWKKSEKNAKAWCSENNISYVSFIIWRKRFEKMSADEASEIFLQVQTEDNSETVEIHFGDFTVSVSNRFEPNCLLNCLRVLQAL